jgi:exosortase
MEMTRDRSPTPGIGEKIIIAAAFVGLFALFSPALYHLYGAWFFDPYYSHGPFIPLVSMYLIWTKRNLLKKTAPGHKDHPIYLLVLSILLYTVAFIIDFRFLMYLAFILSLCGLILFMWGSDILGALKFPLFYLMLMVPLPYAITTNIAFPLQLISSKYASILLDLFNISILQDGVNLYITGYSFVIEKGCSGLNSIIALFTLAVLFAYSVDAPMVKKLFLVFSSFPIAFMANVTRIVVVILVAKTFGKDVAESFFHSFSSIFLFAIALLLLIGTARYTGCLLQKK